MLQLALAALAPFVSAPQLPDVVTTRRASLPTADTRTFEVHAHPGGGAVTLSFRRGFSFGGTSFEALVLERLDENGDVVWSTSTQAPLGTEGYSTAKAVVAPDGRVVVAATVVFDNLTNSQTVQGFDAAGAPAWSTTPPGSGGLTVQGIGINSAGDAVIGGRSGGLFSSTPDAVAYAFDVGDGTLVWEVERPTNDRVHFLSEAGHVFLGYGSASFEARVERIDAAGAVAYSRVEPVEFEGSVVPLAADATGALLARVSWLGPDLYQKLSPGSAVLWSNRFSSVADGAAAGGELLDDGGALVVGAGDPGNPAQDVTRYGADGSVTWRTEFTADSLPAAPRVLSSPTGQIVVPVSYGPFGPNLGGPGLFAPGLEVLDAATGVSQRFIDFNVSPAPLGALYDVVLDERQNLWAAGEAGAFGADLTGLAFRMVLEGDPSVVSCPSTQPNSAADFSTLRAAGSAQVDRDNLTLVASGLPPGVTTLFLNAQSSAVIPNPGGSQGVLCLGAVLSRYVQPGQLRGADASGVASLQLNLPETPQGAGLLPVVAGQSFYFQAWHRDTFLGQATSNLTNAIRVDFN